MNCVQLFIPDFKHTICSYILCSQFQTYYSAKLQGKFITGLIRGLVVSIMQKKIEVGEKVCSVFSILNLIFYCSTQVEIIS